MSLHDRRPQSRAIEERFQNTQYRALWQSTHYETLRGLADQFLQKWRSELSGVSSLDEYTIQSLKRDGRIEGIVLFLQEIERLANKKDE